MGRSMVDMRKGIKNMQESIKFINKALVGKDGNDACPAVIREDKYQLDNDVDAKREPIKGDPKDFKTLFHRGTV